MTMDESYSDFYVQSYSTPDAEFYNPNHDYRSQLAEEIQSNYNQRARFGFGYNPLAGPDLLSSQEQRDTPFLRYPTINTNTKTDNTKSPMAAAALGGAAQAGGSVASAYIGLIGTGIQALVSKRGQDTQSAIANRALDIEYTKFQREWDAASSAGLFSPAQFGNMGNQSTYYTNNGSAAAISRHQYGTWNSVWS